MTMLKTKKWTLLMFMLASLCMLRALSVQAAGRWSQPDDDDDSVDEVYEAEKEPSEEDQYAGQRRGLASVQTDVRFTRPEDSRSRTQVVMGQDEYEQVEGAEYLSAHNTANSGGRTPASSIAVPVKPDNFKVAEELRQAPPTAPRHAADFEYGARVNQSRLRGQQEVSIIASETGFFLTKSLINARIRTD